MEFKANGVYVLTNVSVLEVMIINEDKLMYRFSFMDETDKPQEAELVSIWDEDMQEYDFGFYVEGDDEPYVLSQFMRTSY